MLYPWPKRSRPRLDLDLALGVGLFPIDLKDKENFTSVVVSLVVSTSNFVSAKMAPVPEEFLTWSLVLNFMSFITPVWKI